MMNARDVRESVTLYGVCVALSAWILATAAGQHPNHNFDRVRLLDRASLYLPNWRFFAPIPASKDVVLVHRVRQNGEVGDWEHTHVAPPRRLRHVLWFPERRVDKGVFDVVGRFLRVVEKLGTGYERTPDYRLIRNFVERRVRELYAGQTSIDAFQFAIIRESGYDSEPVEEIFVSRKEVLRGVEPQAGSDKESRRVRA